MAGAELTSRGRVAIVVALLGVASVVTAASLAPATTAQAVVLLSA